MDLTHLTDEQLEEAFKEASANKEPLTPFILEKQQRMNAPVKTADVCPVDPAELNQCDSCQ